MLLEHAHEVVAIEKDRRLVDFLRERFASAPNLILMHDDALKYLRRDQRDWSAWKVVSNLPYSVASPLLVELAQSANGPEHMVCTLQLEVANRLVARPGDKDYGVLTLLVQLDYEPQASFKIPASCFFPLPAVDSACISLRKRPHSLLAPELWQAFFQIVKRSFSQRRKMMLKLLKEDWPMEKLEAAFARLALPLTARAETVSLEQFVRLTQLLSTDPSR